MKITPAKISALIAALLLLLTVAGCTKPHSDPPLMSVPADPPAALAIVTAQPQADHADVAALVAGSARTASSWKSSRAPGRCSAPAPRPRRPSSARPVPPPSLPANPTQFQVEPTSGRKQPSPRNSLRTSGPGALARQPSFRVGRHHDGRDDAMPADRDRIRPAALASQRQPPSSPASSRPGSTSAPAACWWSSAPPACPAAVAPARQPVRDHRHPRQLPGQHARAGRVAGRPAAGRRGPRHRAGARRS